MNTDDIEEIRVFSDLINQNNYFLDRIIDKKNLNPIKTQYESTYSDQLNKNIEKIINIPDYKEQTNNKPASFQVIQEWEGYIQEINEKENKFTAILLDITGNDIYPKEEADFNIEDVNDFDILYLRTGAVFRWIIGYYLSTAGSKRRSSELVFRRMPRFSKSSLQKAEKIAKKLKDEINWE